MRLDAPAAEVTITPEEARRMTLRAQGLLGATPWRPTRAGVIAMLRRVGAVQLDTISVLARSHELVAYARLGPVPREQVEQAYWHPGKPTAFEYWAHAACVLPLEQWPYFAFRRRAFRARGVRWHQSHQETCAKVLARLRAEGPLTATQLGGATAGGGTGPTSRSRSNGCSTPATPSAYGAPGGAGYTTCPSGCCPANCSTRT